MTLVAALTVIRSPIAAFDATPALPVFAVGAVHVRDVPGDFRFEQTVWRGTQRAKRLIVWPAPNFFDRSRDSAVPTKALLIKCGPLVTGGTRGVKHPVHAIDINSRTHQ